MRWTDDKGRERNSKQWSTGIGSSTEDEAETLIANGKHGTVNNLYFSMQPFRRPGNRQTWNLSGLSCCFVDVDYKDLARWKNKDPRIVMTAVLAALDDAGIPAPSFAMDSGNGIHLVWLHTILPAKAISRWNLVQVRLLEALKSYGADPNAKDASRVLRLSGSWNPRARDPRRGHVHLIWIQGDKIAQPFRYDFDILADEILPLTRAEIVSLRAERAKRIAKSGDKRKGRKPAARRDSASYAKTVLEDLHRLRMHRYQKANGRLPAGARDNWLFIASMALSWITPAPALQGQIQALAVEVAGWREREASSRMSSIVRRAKDAAEGKLIEFDGKEVDPRYRMSAETIVKWLKISDQEMRDGGLRVLLNEDARRERNVEACRERRQKAGATSHDEKRAARIELGKRAGWMAVMGLTRKQIAADLGVSEGLIGKAIEEASRVISSTIKNTTKHEAITIRHVDGGIPPEGGTHTKRTSRQTQKTPRTDPTVAKTRQLHVQTSPTAASGSGTVAQATKTAQRVQRGKGMGGTRKMTSTPARHDQSNKRPVPDGSAATSGFRRPHFLRQIG